ncbi:MAG: hypothetical protein PHU23_11825 [Dehalococcoidales bacterium]|nr:hypothetical protein [Dehalococcoidales bacterium]
MTEEHSLPPRGEARNERKGKGKGCTGYRENISLPAYEIGEQAAQAVAKRHH